MNLVKSCLNTITLVHKNLPKKTTKNISKETGSLKLETKKYLFLDYDKNGGQN